MDRKKRGDEAEALARRYLEQQGMVLLERNYRCNRGEVDLIMDHGGTVVFVEVRLRNNLRFGDGAASVDRRKQCKLATTALHYLQQNTRLAKRPARFDVVSIHHPGTNPRIDWIEDAFQYQA